MNHGIIVTHGNFSKELIKTTELVAGKIKNITAISNTGLSLKGLIEKIDEAITIQPDANIILMVEMIGGSPYIAARKAAAGHKNVYLLSGVNIPMLISFCTKGKNLNPDEISTIMKRDAERGIELIKPIFKDE